MPGLVLLLCCSQQARSADGKPKSKTLILFRDELTTRLSDDGARERARVAVSRLLDINEIRNGRLHTDATTWAGCLGRLGITPSDPPDQQWEGFGRWPLMASTRLSRCWNGTFRSSLSPVLRVPRSLPLIGPYILGLAGSALPRRPTPRDHDRSPGTRSLEALHRLASPDAT